MTTVDPGTTSSPLPDGGGDEGVVPGLPGASAPVPQQGGGSAGPGATPPGSSGSRWRRPALVVTGIVVAGALGAGGYAWSQSADSSGAGGSGGAGTPAAAGAARPAGGGGAAPAAPAVPAPTAAVAGLGGDGTLPFSGPLSVHVADGTLLGVSGTDSDGTEVTGTVGPDGSWTASTPLVPLATYTLSATVTDANGVVKILPVSASTTAATKTFSARVTPGDGAVVGVGQAISVRLSTPVTDKAARAAIESHLSVTTTPAVTGAWRWMSSTELRYRGADLWPAGTKISVSAPMDHVTAGNGAWGSGTRTSTFTVGDSLTAVVDVQAHTMTVSQNGAVVKVMKASMGKPLFPTRNGTFVVLEKFADRVMDSATVNLPPGTPAYKTAVKDAVRITNSGTFTHGAPWSVGSQGRANVSHGCINLSPADAHWYFLQAKRGDVVTVVNSTTGPVLSDAGSQDWNLTFDQWKSGSALA